MGDSSNTILSYATPQPRVRRARFLWVLLPFSIGCILGTLLTGYIVCIEQQGYIAAVADYPSSPEGAFEMWLFCATLASPILFLFVFLEVLAIAFGSEHPATARPWWLAAVIGIACPTLPIVLCVRPCAGVVAGWQHVMVADPGIPLAISAVIAAPLLLVRWSRRKQSLQTPASG